MPASTCLVVRAMIACRTSSGRLPSSIKRNRTSDPPTLSLVPSSAVCRRAGGVSAARISFLTGAQDCRSTRARTAAVRSPSSLAASNDSHAVAAPLVCNRAAAAKALARASAGTLAACATTSSMPPHCLRLCFSMSAIMATRKSDSVSNCAAAD